MDIAEFETAAQPVSCFDDGSVGSTTQTVELYNDAKIDLSGVTSIVAPIRSEDWLMINVGNTTAGAELVVGTLTNISNAGHVRINLNHSNSNLTAPGAFTPASKLELIIPTTAEGAPISVAGDFTFPQTDDAIFQLERAKVQLNGNGNQHLEVPTRDEGTAVDVSTLNLEIGQLVIGQTGQTTEVHLSDKFDNDGGFDICSTGEALYLLGLLSNTTVLKPTVQRIS